VKTRKLIVAKCAECKQTHLIYWNLDRGLLTVPKLYCNKCFIELDWHFFDAPLGEDGYVDEGILKDMFSKDFEWGRL